MFRILKTLPKHAILIVVLVTICEVRGNGMLLQPLSRSSRWRFDKSAPVNYNDNSVNCGGYQIQWGENSGKCGLCGDRFDVPQPRPNELGGEFGQGVITREYIDKKTALLAVQITMNHLGFFYFELCNLDEFGEESEECFVKYPLALMDGSFKHYIGTASGMIYLTVVLPGDLLCKHCVLRWTYQAQGRCENGTEGIGCGSQDTFRNCADIAILASPRLPEKVVESLTDNAVVTKLDI